MNPVREFLEKGDYSFEDGLAVLLAYSSNEGVNSFIASSRDRKHLHYELARLAHYPKLDPIPGRKLPKTAKQEKPAQEPAPEPKQEDAPKTETPDEEDLEEDNASYETLERHKHTKLEDMPTPMTRELWIKNRDEYKELQHCHQCMKEANSDAGRADWRKKVHELSKSIKDRWKLIDDEIKRHEEEQKANAAAPAFNPLNCRSYISKALKEDQWDDAKKAEVQHRVDLLLQNGQAIGKDTRERLAARGISLA